ncbi:MAG: M3 family metallopeptidase [Bacteroidales bacterium]
MKQFILLFLTIGLFMGSCTQQDESNPFFSEYDTPFGVPPFEEIEIEHFKPAFEKAMEEQNAKIESIVNTEEEPTFENTIVPMVYSGESLSKVSSVFYGLNSANTNDEMQELAQEMSPELSSHRDAISMNADLFERIKTVYENKDDFDLDEEESFLLEDIYLDFVRSGANLSEEKKEKLKDINRKLSSLTQEYGQNVLKETNSFEMVIEDEDNLAGLPESVIETAAETAEEKGYENKWVFTTQKPSMIPFLQYAKNRDLREKLYKAYLDRGNNDNEYDNKEILSDIIKLRGEKAQLLGYDTYADYELERRMAKEPGNVMDLLNKLWDASLPVAKEERDAMQKMIDEKGKDFELKSWDWWYYAEKIRKEKFDLDDSDLRPYFELNNVREGAFNVANKLYGITFKEVKDVPKPHPDARAWEVKEEDGSHLGLLFMDFHPRDSKRGGAWCGRYRSQHTDQEGERVAPLVTVVCNFTKPSGDKPALLSLDETETLFHEFGHALDGLFNTNKYPRTSIPRDFVELPSQIMEHWVSQEKVLEDYARHYETDEVIPDELVQKMEESQNFNQGFETVEYLAASLLDMEYHTMEEPKDIEVMEFENDYLESMGLIPEIEPRYHSTYFTHITGGYAAGYYSYIWSGVLDNDAFEAFEENGIFDQETAAKFRTLLEKDGYSDAMELYKQFRGREPKEDALLRNRGLK